MLINNYNVIISSPIITARDRIPMPYLQNPGTTGAFHAGQSRVIAKEFGRHEGQGRAMLAYLPNSSQRCTLRNDSL